MSETKKKNGRPLKFRSVKQMQDLIDKWEKDCKENNKPLTITGLALALDTNRHTLINYQKKEKFFNAIYKAKLMCENYAEEFLYAGKNVSGAIFNLKNNYNWKDKQEVERSGSIDINIIKEK